MRRISQAVPEAGALGGRLREQAVRLQSKSRNEKWELYERVFPPRRGERVLDVGASSLDDLPNENYFLHRYPYPDQLTAVGIDDVVWLGERYPGVTFLRADGRALPFEDGSFDVVHSNAVVEHVGPPAEQAKFVRELARVAKTGFVTTPNRWFPIEIHSRIPLVHWLPRRVVIRIADLLDEPNLRWWLLGERELRGLFPPAVEIAVHHTRLLGLPLTLVALFRVPDGEQTSTLSRVELSVEPRATGA